MLYKHGQTLIIFKLGMFNFQNMSLHGDFIQPGAQTNYTTYVEKPTCVTKTVISNSLPSEIVYEYQTNEFISRITETFLEKDDDTTLWTQKTNYIQFDDKYFESMAKMFIRRFEMKSQLLMDNFKEMMEKMLTLSIRR